MKKRWNLVSFVCVGLVVAALVSCGGSAKDTMAVQTTSAAAPRMAAKAMGAADYAGASNFNAKAEAVEMEMVAEEAVFEDGAPLPSPDGGSASVQQERKLIKNGSISLEVEQLAAAEESVTAWCAAYGGYVSSSYNHENGASFTARIPAAQFDSAMESAGDLGRVLSRSISAQDVSEQFYDLQTRLDTRKILRDRLQSYLAEAGNIEDLIHIEGELNSVLSEIESMEGRMRRLSNQIDYSTISVDLSLPYRTTDQGFQWPSLDRNVRRFLSNVVDFFVGFVGIVLYIVVFGAPILALTALLYWLLLGKVGLLKKIFRRLK